MDDDEFRVLVRDAPEKDWYTEFEEYAGDPVHVPDDPDASRRCRLSGLTARNSGLNSCL